MIKASADVLALPLEIRALMAFETAFEKVLDQHERLGLPLSIWEDGKVKELSAAELIAHLSKTH